MKHVHYIDKDTGISYRFAASLLGYGHVLERRRQWWIFTWWVERASMYDSIISGEHRFSYLVEWLLWAERKKAGRGFIGYPEGGN
jgi:hypothetical protein